MRILHSPSGHLVGSTESPKGIDGAGLDAWALDPQVSFLNHGSFGARARKVIEYQAALRDQFESAPIELLDRRWRGETLAEARDSVATFLGADGQDLGFVHNATTGVATVLRNLHWREGDEIVTTDHAYNAVYQMMRYVDHHHVASLRQIEVPFPSAGPNEVIDKVVSSLSSSTRLIVIDHVTSPSALRLPVEAICTACQERGVDVLIDGAHAPGMFDLDLPALGCAYYTGNLHKWVSSPPGAAFLWVRKDRQQGIHPLTVSHHYQEGFAQEFLWQGTGDLTPWLTSPFAIAWLGQFDWHRVRQRNRAMAIWAQAMFCDAWSVEPASSLDGAMLGSMATVQLPGDAEAWESHWKDTALLMQCLYEDHRIEVPVMMMHGKWWIRVSCHLHNSPEQYEQLADVMLKEMKKIGVR